MTDLEEHAFKRDKRFVVRLILALTVASLAGMYLFANLTSQRTAGCAAEIVTGAEVKDEAK